MGAPSWLLSSPMWMSSSPRSTGTWQWLTSTRPSVAPRSSSVEQQIHTLFQFSFFFKPWFIGPYKTLKCVWLRTPLDFPRTCLQDSQRKSAHAALGILCLVCDPRKLSFNFVHLNCAWQGSSCLKRLASLILFISA